MRLGSPGGTAIILHPLTLATAAAAAVAGHGTELALVAAALLAHETGHLLACRLVGIRPVRLVLWPFGAGIELEPGVPRPPAAESTVAAAGPLASLLLAGVAALAVAAGGGGAPARLFLAANLAIGALNTLPAPPLDGGRWLRAGVAARWGAARAALAVRRASAAVQAAALALGAGLAAAGFAAASPTLLAAGFQAWALFAVARLAARRPDPDIGMGPVRAATVLVSDAVAPAGAALAWGDPAALLVWVMDGRGGLSGPVSGRAIARALAERGAGVRAGELAPPGGGAV